jgi:peptide/nickel transport system permease protein
VLAAPPDVVATAGRAATWANRVRGLRLPWIPLTVLLLLAVCAIFAPWIAPHDPTAISMDHARVPPGADWSFPLGTDVLGRDILSRLIFGARTTMIISLTALSSGVLLGTVLGLVSGYIGGWIDTLIMRTADAALGFPTILVAVIVVVMLSTGPESIIVAVALTTWAQFARMIRGEVLSIKQLDFVVAAQVAGLSTPRIIIRHVFPNTISVMMVITSLLMGQVILLEASLGFLALGLPPGAPAWGVMVSEGRGVILDMWWLSLFPGLAITSVVLAFNFLGDWLRDTLDPRLRRI